MKNLRMISVVVLALVGPTTLMLPSTAAADPPPHAFGSKFENVRISPDATPDSYRGLHGEVDATHAGCAVSRHPQAEGTVAIDPSDPEVIVVGAMDACITRRHPIPAPMPQHWAALYRSEDAGSTWDAALMPGYPGDTSPAGIESQNGCQIQADSTISFDLNGRLFYGGLCLVWQGDAVPADFQIAVATFEDHGRRLVRTVRADGPEGPPLTPADANTASDKPNLVVDQSSSPYSGNIYVSYTVCPRLVPEKPVHSIAPCVGPDSIVKVVRSTDQGRTFEEPVTIETSTMKRPHFTDLAVGPDGTLYLVIRTDPDADRKRRVFLARSTDGGATFSEATLVAEYATWDSNTFAGGSFASTSCGDGSFSCPSGYKYPPLQPTVAVAADHHGVTVVWGASLPDGQGKIFSRSSPDGVNWPDPAAPLNDVSVGHQWMPDIASDGKVLSLVFQDSRFDPAYSPSRPPGATAQKTSSGPSVDVFVARSHNGGRTWVEDRVSEVSSEPNFEIYMDARLAWRGDYLYVSSVPGGTYAVWPDSRDIIAGVDTRPDSPADGFDVYAPCLWLPNTIHAPITGHVAPLSDDPCLQQGGLDQNIYGARI